MKIFTFYDDNCSPLTRSFLCVLLDSGLRTRETERLKDSTQNPSSTKILCKLHNVRNYITLTHKYIL